MTNIYYGGSLLKSLDVDDSSYRLRELMGSDVVVLRFSLPEYFAFPAGCYVDVDGETYMLYYPAKVTKYHDRSYEYVLQMQSAMYALTICIMRDVTGSYGGATPVYGGTGRCSFSLTDTPYRHMQTICDCLNMFAGDALWTVDECIGWDGSADTGEQVPVTYDYVSCADALRQLAEACGAEYWRGGFTLSLGRCELYKSNPLPVAYGKNNGLLSGVVRTLEREFPPVRRMYVQGGDRNIDPSKYGLYSGQMQVSQVPSSTLLLPYRGEAWYDGETFSNASFAGAAHYAVSDDRRSVTREADMSANGLAEDTMDCTDIYPSRVGTVTQTVAVDAAKNLYDIVDSSIPSTLDYNNYLVAGETMRIVFQTGQLAGKEFDVAYIHNALNGKAGRRFELKPADIDGVSMPNSDGYAPAQGDKYAVFGCSLPQAYYDDGNGNGAEWEMFARVVRRMWDCERDSYVVNAEADPIWLNAHRSSPYTAGGRTFANGVQPYIAIGAHMTVTDAMLPSGVLMRVTAIREPWNDRLHPQLTLSSGLRDQSFRTVWLSKIALIRRNSELARQEAEREARRLERRVSADRYVEDRTAIVSAVNELGSHVNDYLTLFGRVKTAFINANIPYDDCIEIVEQGSPGCKMIEDVDELVIGD